MLILSKKWPQKVFCLPEKMPPGADRPPVVTPLIAINYNYFVQYKTCYWQWRIQNAARGGLLQSPPLANKIFYDSTPLVNFFFNTVQNTPQKVVAASEKLILPPQKGSVPWPPFVTLLVIGFNFRNKSFKNTIERVNQLIAIRFFNQLIHIYFKKILITNAKGIQLN